MSARVLAHIGKALQPHDLATAWSLDGFAIALLLAMAMTYARGSSVLLARASGDARAIHKVVRSRRFFVWGWAVLAVALVSPLHAFGETLLSAHMVQHELLVALAAPLLIMGRPDVAFLHALPAGRRTRGLVRPFARTWRVLAQPVTAAAIHGTAIVVGHMPAVYQATLTNDAAHAAQHVGFFGTAMLFWWSILRARGDRAGRGVSIMMLFLVMTATGVLGAWLAWSRILWYPAYVLCNPSWGLNPLEDQQLAGLIMWIPGGLAYLAVAIRIFSSWMRESENRVVRRETLRMAARGASMLLLAAIAGGCADSRETVEHDAMMLTGGNPHAGRLLIRDKGCGTCHAVPGVTGATGRVGPPLSGIATRAYVGGVVENTPDNLVRWLVNPQALSPGTAMPAVGLSEQQARHVAAYLYTLR